MDSCSVNVRQNENAVSIRLKKEKNEEELQAAVEGWGRLKDRGRRTVNGIVVSKRNGIQA